jgi:GNAT superfamily N-acetyltransferase
MPTLHQITPPLTFAYKTVRLRALQDTPYAFGSTYARESQFTDEEWQQRTANLSTPRSIGYLAHEDDYCGIALSFLKEQNPQQAELISMWVAPEQRGTGTGRLLIETIEFWALSREAHTLCLMVTEINQPAIAFYQRLGFTKTGRTQPYPNDPALIEYEMSKPLR